MAAITGTEWEKRKREQNNEWEKRKRERDKAFDEANKKFGERYRAVRGSWRKLKKLQMPSAVAQKSLEDSKKAFEERYRQVQKKWDSAGKSFYKSEAEVGHRIKQFNLEKPVFQAPKTEEPHKTTIQTPKTKEPHKLLAQKAVKKRIGRAAKKTKAVPAKPKHKIASEPEPAPAKKPVQGKAAATRKPKPPKKPKAVEAQKTGKNRSVRKPPRKKVGAKKKESFYEKVDDSKLVRTMKKMFKIRA